MTPGFAELLKGAPLILLDRPDRAVSTGPTQFLHDLRRRAGQRAERAQQARVFVSPLFVFGWKHPSNPKRIGNGPTIRRERIDHPKPLQNIARTEFPSGHLAPAPRDNGERSASRLCAPTPLRKLARGLSFLNEADRKLIRCMWKKFCSSSPRRRLRRCRLPRRAPDSHRRRACSALCRMMTGRNVDRVIVPSVSGLR